MRSYVLPKAVNLKSVYEIHNGQYDQQLPKALNEALAPLSA